VSELEQALSDYLQLRHSLGHQLAEAQWLLPGFVAYLDTQGLRTVTVQAALEWVQQSPSGRVTSVGPRRMTAVRGFARVMTTPSGLTRPCQSARRSCQSVRSPVMIFGAGAARLPGLGAGVR